MLACVQTCNGFVSWFLPPPPNEQYLCISCFGITMCVLFSWLVEILHHFPSFIFLHFNVVLASRAQPHLKTFWGHAKVELVPPNPAQWPEVKKGFSQVFQSAVTGKFLNLTVKEASKKVLVGVEIACWFVVGEMIGRRSIIGYKV